MLSINKTSRRALNKGCNVGRVQVNERKDIKGSKNPYDVSPSIQYFKFKHWKIFFFSRLSSLTLVLKSLSYSSSSYQSSLIPFIWSWLFLAQQYPLYGLLSILSCGQITHSYDVSPSIQYFKFKHWKIFFFHVFHHWLLC